MVKIMEQITEIEMLQDFECGQHFFKTGEFVKIEWSQKDEIYSICSFMDDEGNEFELPLNSFRVVRAVNV